MANTVVAVRQNFRLPMPQGVPDLDAAKWRVLVEAIFPMARSTEAVVLALDYCRVRGLDIMKRPVNIVPVWNSNAGKEIETIWPSINETQITAARTHEWAGMDTPVWGPVVTSTFRGNRKTKEGWKHVEETILHPEWCSVTVHRLIAGTPRAFTEQVFWLEAYGHGGASELPSAQWLKRPRGMLAKVAKAAALRAAFPEESDGPTAEEMAGQEVEGPAEPPAPKWTGPPAHEAMAQAQRDAPAAAPAAPAPAAPEAKGEAAKPAAEIVDAESGEITDAPAADAPEPQALPLIMSDDGQVVEWRAWGASLLSVLRAADSIVVFENWLRQNEGALIEMEQQAPKLAKNLKASVQRARAEIAK